MHAPTGVYVSFRCVHELTCGPPTTALATCTRRRARVWTEHYTEGRSRDLEHVEDNEQDIDGHRRGNGDTSVLTDEVVCVF